MHELQEHGGGLRAAEWDSVDPDRVADLLLKIAFNDGGIGSAVWSTLLALDLDPRVLEKNRMRMKLQLARYARQPLSQWANVEVTEIKRLHAALIEMINAERETDAAGATLEDL